MKSTTGLQKSPQADKKTLMKLNVFKEDKKEIIENVKRLKLQNIFNTKISQ